MKSINTQDKNGTQSGKNPYFLGPIVRLHASEINKNFVVITDCVPVVNMAHALHKVLTSHDFFGKLSRRDYSVNLISTAMSLPGWSLVYTKPVLGGLLVVGGTVTFVLSSPVWMDRLRVLRELFWVEEKDTTL